MISRVLLNIAEAASPPEPDDTISLDILITGPPYDHTNFDPAVHAVRRSIPVFSSLEQGQASTSTRTRVEDDTYTYNSVRRIGEGVEVEIVEVMRSKPGDPE